MSNQKVYKVTPEQISNFKAAIAVDKDTTLQETSPSEGTLTHGSGLTKVIVGYIYDPDKSALTVKVEKCPPFTSSAVIAHISELIAKS